MTNPQQLIIYLTLIYACISCSGGNFDIKNDKIRSLIEAGVDSIHVNYYFPGEKRESGLPEEFLKFYKSRSYNLAWLAYNKPKKQASELLEALYAAPEHGLEADNYHVGKIKAQLDDLYNMEDKKEKSKGRDKIFNNKREKQQLRQQDTLRFRKIAQLDFLLTASYLTYASHLYSGIINPNKNKEWFPPIRKKNLSQYLEDALNKKDIKESLDALAPSHDQYRSLQKYLSYFRRFEGDTIPLVNSTLQLGDKGKEVIKAKKRLVLWENDLARDAGEVFDAEMEAAVKQFQNVHGLEASGKLNTAELRLLNKPLSHWISKIETNMERMRWVRQDFGDEYVFINIPAYQLKVMKDKTPKIEMKVIVGTNYKKTPVFSDTLEHVVFNPTWTVPTPIAIEEMLPQIQDDEDYLSDRNLRLYDGWQATAKELDPEDVDWEDIDSTTWHFRVVQAAGPGNPLGNIKFMMPNSQAIYLHDTPASHLFDEKELTFSHGCIRVEKPLALAKYLLNWDQKKIQAHIDSGQTQKVVLDKKIPVHIVYWSAWVDEEGLINFREDIYDHDRTQERKIERKEKIL